MTVSFALFHQLPREILQYLCSQFLTGKDLSTLWLAHITVIGNSSNSRAKSDMDDDDLNNNKKRQQELVEQQQVAESFLLLLYHVLNERLTQVLSPSPSASSTEQQLKWDPSEEQKLFICQLRMELGDLQRQLHRRRRHHHHTHIGDSNHHQDEEENDRSSMSCHHQKHQTRHFSTICLVLDYFDEAIQRMTYITRQEDSGPILWCGKLETGILHLNTQRTGGGATATVSAPASTTTSTTTTTTTTTHGIHAGPTASSRLNGAYHVSRSSLLNLMRSQLHVKHEDGIKIVIRSSSSQGKCWSLRGLDQWRAAAVGARISILPTNNTLQNMHNSLHSKHDMNMHIHTMNMQSLRQWNAGLHDPSSSSGGDNKNVLPLIRTRAQPYNFIPIPPYGRVYGKTEHDTERLLEISRYLAKTNMVLVKSANSNSSIGDGIILRIISSEQGRNRLRRGFGKDGYRPPDSWIVEDPTYDGLICSWEYSNNSNNNNNNTARSSSSAMSTAGATGSSFNDESSATTAIAEGLHDTNWSETILEILNNFYHNDNDKDDEKNSTATKSNSSTNNMDVSMAMS